VLSALALAAQEALMLTLSDRRRITGMYRTYVTSLQKRGRRKLRWRLASAPRLRSLLHSLIPGDNFGAFKTAFGRLVNRKASRLGGKQVSDNSHDLRHSFR
jgi:integrase